jgi:hypothetical protein
LKCKYKDMAVYLKDISSSYTSRRFLVISKTSMTSRFYPCRLCRDQAKSLQVPSHSCPPPKSKLHSTFSTHILLQAQVRRRSLSARMQCDGHRVASPSGGPMMAAELPSGRGVWTLYLYIYIYMAELEHTLQPHSDNIPRCEASGCKMLKMKLSWRYNI